MLMTNFRITFTVLLALALGGTAFAQSTTPAPTTSAPAPDRVKFKKRTVIEFRDVTLNGTVERPNGARIVGRTKTKFPILIQIRRNFDAKLLHSIDRL